MSDAPNITRPLIRYHGGKFLLADWIISHFCDHRTYVEPFGGGGSVLLKKQRCYAEIYNDLHSEIVNLFRVARDNGDELLEKLYATPFSRDEFKDSFYPHEDAMEQARRTVARSFMGFGSAAATKNLTGDLTRIGKPTTGFRANSNRSGTTPAHDWKNYPDALPAIIERLRGVVIENKDAKDVMLQHDSIGTLHYVDPPYVPVTRDKGTDYSYELSENDHIELCEFLKSLKGSVVLSGYDNAIYNKSLTGWHKSYKKSFADGANERLEVLWLNYNPEKRQTKLFA